MKKPIRIRGDILAVFYDILLLAVMACIILHAWRCGFISTLMSLLAWVVALVIAVLFSDRAAEWIYDVFIRQRLIDTVAALLPADVIDSVRSGITSVQDAAAAIEDALSGLRFLGIDTSLLTDTGSSDSLLSLFSMSTGDMAVMLVDNYLEPLVLQIVSVIVSVVIFLLVLMIMRFAIRATRSRQRHTVLGRTNQLLGAVLGLGEALIAGYLLALILCSLAQLSGGKLTWLNESLLNRTAIVRYLKDLKLS